MHGHTFTVEVFVEGLVNQQGMVLDFHKLGDILKNVHKIYDHKLIVSSKIVKTKSSEVRLAWGNFTMEIPRDKVVILPGNEPTSENLADAIREMIVKKIGNQNLKVDVRLWEGKQSYAQTN